MRALRKLLDAGHSLVVIEHNLDVIRATDWLIDLGPEGGDGGGWVVAEGTPEAVREHATSHTGAALRDYAQAIGAAGHAVHEDASALLKRELQAQARKALQAKNTIEIVNAREHNLKSLSVRHSARQVQRGHGRQRLGQVHAGVRHPVQRRPAPLPRIAQRLCAQHRAAGRPARGRCGLRHSAHRGDRAAPVARRPQVHRRHDHRGLALPAPALRQARHAALHPRRRGGAAANDRQHRRAAAAELPRPAHRPAGAAGAATARASTPSWPTGRARAATRTCASMATSCRRRRSRASTASRSTPSSCRW